MPAAGGMGALSHWQTGSYRLVRRIGPDKRPRVYECYWAHFAAEIHLSELFEC